MTEPMRNVMTTGSTVWTRVCAVTDLEPFWGEAALVGRHQIALFRLDDERVFATGNRDPATGSAVMSRGIVGSRAGAPTIASPLHKDVFDLETGACLTKPGLLNLPVWRVDIRDGDVFVAATSALVAASHGTSDPIGRTAVATLVQSVRDRRPELTVCDAFVDVQQPDVPATLDMLDPEASAVVVPLLLSAGYHVHVDLAEAARDTDRDVRVSGALGPDVRLAHLLARRLAEAGLREDDIIVLAAAGSSDPRAVADCHTMGALLEAELQRPVTVSFVSAAKPSVPDAVAAARVRSVRRVVIATYLLAPGYFADLVKQAGADVTTEPLLTPTGPAPEELVAIVSDLFDAQLVASSS